MEAQAIKNINSDLRAQQHTNTPAQHASTPALPSQHQHTSSPGGPALMMTLLMTNDNTRAHARRGEGSVGVLVCRCVGCWCGCCRGVVALVRWCWCVLVLARVLISGGPGMGLVVARSGCTRGVGVRVRCLPSGRRGLWWRELPRANQRRLRTPGRAGRW